MGVIITNIVSPIKGLFIWIIILFIFSSFSSIVIGFETDSESVSFEASIPKQNDVLGKQGNNFTISIKGGFGFSIEICNYGNTTLYLVNWSISIDGLVFLGMDFGGSISEILPGECVNIGSILILGIGQINITIQIDDIIESASGYLIGPFVILR
ncbi:MAG: hypothetical protein JSV67_02545 [Thermoplasmatales archaeon]|nr:MAG: hypothetical protein JSV67_02545 [Thermoplasmatales archaeon]